MNSKIKILLSLLILLFIYTTLCAISYANTTSTDIANSVLRLHVIANSDTPEDQALKYKVRDNILKYMNTLSINCSNKEESIQLVSKHINDFKKIASDTVRENGYNYDISVSIGNFDFPTKHYGDISLPSGFYDALKIEIGNASGQNWWCVMFPPLCFVDVTSGIVPDESKEQIKNSLSEEEFTLISDTEDNTIKFKFKILELFNNGLTTAKK